jgi:AraC-like DNA-binding protein
MIIQKYQPKILHNYIESFKTYQFDQDMDIKLFPKGVFEIVFQSNDHFSHNTAYSSGWKTRPIDFIGGLHNKSYHVKSTGNKNFCFVVEFKPNTAKYFIPSKLHDFENNVIDISEIWGNQALELSQKIRKEKSDANKIKLIEAFLLDKFIAQKASIIDNAIYNIHIFKGFVEVNELASKATLSAAQFRKRFREEIGISPSQYCKIIRINTSLAIFENNYNKTLTELTYDLGYFDQSHFIKDFKSVTGSSPKFFKTQFNS